MQPNATASPLLRKEAPFERDICIEREKIRNTGLGREESVENEEKSRGIEI